MMIAEMFYSIQGEGRFAGLPSAFICTTDGPPRETWCDAPQKSWKPDEAVMLGALLANVRREWYSYAVITGGEPLNEPELDIITDGLRRIEHHVTIETSGAVHRELPCDLMSVNIRLRNPAIPVPKPGSKKAPTFDPPAYDIDALRQIVAGYDYQLKFEVSERSEMEEILHLVREIGADRTKVLLLPAATKPKERKEQLLWIPEATRFFGYRYAPRIAMTPEAPKPAVPPGPPPGRR